MQLLSLRSFFDFGLDLLRSWKTYCALVPVWLLLIGLALGPSRNARSRMQQTMRLNAGHWVPEQIMVAFAVLVYAEDVDNKFPTICANLFSLFALQTLEMVNPLLFRSSHFPGLEETGKWKFAFFAAYELCAHLAVAYGFVVLYNALDMATVPLAAETFPSLTLFCPAVFYCTAGVLLFANRLWYGHSAEEEAKSLRPLEQEYRRVQREYGRQQERIRQLQIRRARELNGFSWS